MREVLADELGMEPERETTRLYKQIQAGELERPATLSEAPSSEALTTQSRTAIVLASRGYELRERVGVGGFGEVYRAFQPAIGRDVAIKVIMPQHAQDPEFVQRFETEARLVARLEHPHIVPLYDFWQGSGGAYLVMGSKHMRADINFAWPSAEIAVMGPDGAVNIVFRREIEAAADPEAKRKELVEQYRERFANPYVTASRGFIDDVIEPRDTRLKIIGALEMLQNKTDSNPPKKHGNIPL